MAHLEFANGRVVLHACCTHTHTHMHIQRMSHTCDRGCPSYHFLIRMAQNKIDWIVNKLWHREPAFCFHSANEMCNFMTFDGIPFSFFSTSLFFPPVAQASRYFLYVSILQKLMRVRCKLQYISTRSFLFWLFVGTSFNLLIGRLRPFATDVIIPWNDGSCLWLT